MIFFAAAGLNAVASENVYRNGPADQATSSIFRFATVTAGVSQEWGDEVTLGSSGHTITEMMVYTVGDFDPPVGSEQIRIRLYVPDGAPVGTPPLPSPGTVLWDSGPLAMKPGWRAQRIAVPDIVVPDTFVWTASFENVSGLPFNRAGLTYFGPPSKGASSDFVWRKNPGFPWSYQVTTWTNGSTAYGSFGASFWADGPPGPEIFDSTQSPTRAFRVTPTTEIGDDVIFDGVERFVSVARIEYLSDIALPEGDEKACVRVYDRNNADPGGAPSTLLYDSGFQPIDVSVGGHLMSVYPEMTFPDDIIWTIEFSGVTQAAGDSLSIPARTDPFVGGSVPLFWSRDGSGLSEYWFGDPTYDPTSWPSTTQGYNNIIANFSALFSTDVPPTVVENTDPPTVLPGTVFSGTSANVLFSDNIRWVLRPGVVLSTSLPPIAVVYNHFLPVSAASSLRVTVESRASANRIHQQIQIWDFLNPGWDTFDLVPALPYSSQPDLVRTVDFGDPTPYIGPGNEVRVRTRYRANGPVLQYPWSVSIDREYVTFRP